MPQPNNRDELIDFLAFAAFLCFLLGIFFSVNGCAPAPPPCAGGQALESGHCLRGDMHDAAPWADSLAFRLGLQEPRNIWLYEHGNDVTAQFPGPIPPGGCVNGYFDPETGDVVAIPGTLAHELLHARSADLGELVPVNPSPGIDAHAMYEAQHTPAHGWRDTYDDEVRDAYQFAGWPDNRGTVCDNWGDW